MPISCFRCSSELLIGGGLDLVLLLDVLVVLLDEMSLIVCCSGWTIVMVLWCWIGDMLRLYRLTDDVFGFMCCQLPGSSGSLMCCSVWYSKLKGLLCEGCWMEVLFWVSVGLGGLVVDAVSGAG